MKRLLILCGFLSACASAPPRETAAQSVVPEAAAPVAEAAPQSAAEPDREVLRAQCDKMLDEDIAAANAAGPASAEDLRVLEQYAVPDVERVRTEAWQEMFTLIRDEVFRQCQRHGCMFEFPEDAMRTLRVRREYQQKQSGN